MQSRQFLLLLLFVVNIAYATEPKEPPRIGNFALPGSQQPGQFLSFGANILDKGQSQFSLMASDYHGPSSTQATLAPAYIYGLTENASILVQLPYAISYKDDVQHSSSIADTLVQFESAFYNHKTACYEELATIVTGIFIPTGDRAKNPPTGTGSMSLLVGATFTRTYIDWLYFTSLGIQWGTKNEEFKPGNLFIYQFGLGKNIFNIGSEWILAWVVELDGQYTQRDHFGRQGDSNSGGNEVFLTPSFFISSKSLAFQIGAGMPVIQDLNGEQNKNHFVLAAQAVLSLYP